MNPQELVKKIQEEWGERSVYFVSFDEFRTLLQEFSATVLDENNEDGTYFSCIEVGGRQFTYSGQQKIGE